MSFTNRIVIEKIKEIGLNGTVKFLYDSHHSSKKCDMKEYRNCVDKIYKTYKGINKNKGRLNNEEILEAFYTTSVTYPAPRISATNKRKLQIDVVEAANLETLKDVTVDLVKELNECNENNKKLKLNLSILKKTVKGQQQSKIKITKRVEQSVVQPYIKQQMIHQTRLN
jgi:hypothetical protein